MKSLRYTLISLLAVAGMAHAQVHWETNYDAAVRKASAHGQRIFIDFNAEWCGPCKMLASDVFTKPSVMKMLGKVVCVSLNVDSQPPVAARFSVNAIPRLVLFTPDGRNVLWDGVGYRDAPTFTEEFGKALGIKNPGGKTYASTEPPALTKLRNALETNSFGKLKAASPETAQKGLQLLVGELGVFQESDLKPVADLVKKAGKDALPALVDGMAHKTLAVRVGSYRVLRTIVNKDQLGKLAFDPWAPSGARQAELASWRAWLKREGSR
jgi:thiol-disulfide isomerase/thioredoxin